MDRFESRVIGVTGGASGIGAASEQASFLTDATDRVDAGYTAR